MVRSCIEATANHKLLEATIFGNILWWLREAVDRARSKNHLDFVWRLFGRALSCENSNSHRNKGKSITEWIREQVEAKLNLFSPESFSNISNV